MSDGGWVATHEDVTDKVQADIALRKSEKSFSDLFEYSLDALMLFDSRGAIKLANNEAYKIFGYDLGELIDQPVEILIPQAARKEHAGLRDRYSQAPKRRPMGTMQADIQGLRKDGSAFPADISINPLNIAGEKMVCATVRDITKAKLAEDELRRTKKFLNTVIEHVPLPILVKDVPRFATDARDLRFTLVNRAFEALLGISRDQIIGKTTHELYPKDRADAIVERDFEALQSDQPVNVSEHNLVTPANETRCVTATKVAIRDKNETPKYLLTVLDDVTERRRVEEHIWHLAHNDSLTKLPNRSSFLAHIAAVLDQASETDEQFSVLCIDLDRFKEINDDFGHLVGDELLYEVACRLKTATAGAFLARVGGDEFALIVTGGSQPATAEAICDRLFAAFKDEFVVDGHRLKLGLSIGGAVYPGDGTDTKTLMTNADAALYWAKAEVRGHAWFFKAELGKRLRERRDLRNDLGFAIQRGDIFLHYQPQKKMASGEIVGFESLARWQCPKRGVVSPGTFIPVAEESGLIIPLGEWVLREACREAASWPQPLKIAVNISPIQFRQGDLPNLVHSILLETGLAPARLELEITEGVLINDFSLAVSILRKLKSLGVQIAMDDFGSGYSSLAYLHSFSFDKIKIDRSFVGDLENNQHSMAIVRAIVTLGHSLDVPILAEGLETEAQRVFLAREGCDEVQGFLIGRPLPIEDYAELVGRPAHPKRTYLAATG